MAGLVEQALSAFRDFETDGVPASGAHEPVKADIRAALAGIIGAIQAAVAGIATYATKADLLVSASPVAGRQARVYADSTAANNGIYVYRAGAWGIDTDFYTQLQAVVQPLVDQAQAAALQITDIDDAARILTLIDSADDQNILAYWNVATGQMTFAPDDATLTVYANANAAVVTAENAIKATGQRASNLFRPKLSTTVTAASATTSDATLTKAYSYSVTPALFTFFGGVAGTYNTFYTKIAQAPVPSGGNLGTANQYVGRMAVMTDAPSIEFALSGTTAKWRAYVDHQPVNDPAAFVTTGGAIVYQKIVLGTAKALGRRVDIEWDLNSGVSNANTLRVPPGYSIWAVDPANRLRIVVDGDSYSTSTGASAGMLGFASEFGRSLAGMDADIWITGAGGSGYTQAGAGYVATSTIRMDQVQAANPDVIIMALGLNDAGQAGIQAAALTALQGRRTRCPNALIIVLGSWGATTGPSANVIAAENAVKAAVNQVADDACIFVPVSTAAEPWTYGTGYFNAKNGSGNSDWQIGGVAGTDITHPRDIGHRYLGAVKLAEAVRPLLRHARKVN